MNNLPLQNMIQQHNGQPIITLNQIQRDQSGRTLLTSIYFRMIKPQLPNLPNLDLRFLLDTLPSELKSNLEAQQLPQFIPEPFGVLMQFQENEQEQSNGATEDEIKQIKVVELNEQNINEFQKDCCPICYDTFSKGQNVQLLNCKHAFHQNCLTQWLKVNSICPLCRAAAINQSN